MFLSLLDKLGKICNCRKWFTFRTLVSFFLLLTAILVILYFRSLQRTSKNNMGNWRDAPVSRRSTPVPLTDDLTVVTAYFNIGQFRHGYSDFRGTTLYRKWMTIFASIENPVIAFLDNDDDYQFFVSIRSVLPENLTKIIRVERQNLRSFRMEGRIAEIFRYPGYPKYYPNTVLPAYSAAMHAKYEVMQLALIDNPFHTKYFCWLDIGLFKRLTSPKAIRNRKPLKTAPRFRLELPYNFSSDSVAYTEVFKRKPNITLKTIVFRNEAWIAGGYFVGERSVLYRWTEEYENATKRMLAYNLMSSDQQVVYYLFNELDPKTKIQTYSRTDGRHDEWYYLGYISRKRS